MNKRVAITVLSAASIFLAGTATVLAAPGDRGDRGARLERMIERLDADQSGAVSFEEFSRRSDEMFTRTDVDGDGNITSQERVEARLARQAEREEKAEERRGKMRERGEERVEKVDANGDGTVSKEEHVAHQQSRFSELDTDGDGQVTTAEFAENFKGKRGGRKGRPG